MATKYRLFDNSLCIRYEVRDKNCSQFYFCNIECYANSNLLLSVYLFTFFAFNTNSIFSFILLVFKCFFFKTPSRLGCFNISFVCKTNYSLNLRH